MVNETVFLGGRPVLGLGIANPASENCVAKGGAIHTVTDPNGGQRGICAFQDGSSCEEWALFHGECRPGENLPQKHISPLLTFPVGGAVIGGLIGYGVKRDAHGAAVGALVGAAPFALAAAILATGWRR